MNETLAATQLDTAEVLSENPNPDEELRRLAIEEDRRLLGLHQSGDELALGEIIRRHQPTMNAIARGYFTNREDVEDAVMSASTKIWQKIDSFEDQGRGLGPWINTIVYHECINMYRHQKCQPQLCESDIFDLRQDSLGAFASGQLSPEDQTVENDHEPLVEALARLNPDFRNAIVATHLNDEPGQEYADKTGTNLGTVRSRAKRGREQLLSRAGIDIKHKKSEYTRNDVIKMSSFLNGIVEVESD